MQTTESSLTSCFFSSFILRKILRMVPENSLFHMRKRLVSL